MTNPVTNEEIESAMSEDEATALWQPNTFNYTADEEELKEINMRVVARMKDPDLSAALRKIAVAGGAPDESSIAATMQLCAFVHTSYEMGVEATQNDMQIAMKTATEAVASDLAKNEKEA